MNDEDIFPYLSASAFDSALKDRLEAAASVSVYELNELRRQFAYDRLLTRVFSTHPDRWILKGGGGLLARIPGQARHSMDIDLFYSGELGDAVADLQAIGSDNSFGDFFTFDIARNPGQTVAGATGFSLSVAAFLGEKEFQRFTIDLVISSNMTQDPDVISGLTPVSIPGLQVVDYRVYSVVDHVADKHAAMIDTYGDGARPSTRYRDLVDLVLVATTQHVSAGDLRAALVSEYRYRGLEIPVTVEAPDATWGAGYGREAAKVPHLQEQSLADGLAAARRFLDPVLAGLGEGQWNPNSQVWITGDAG